LKTKEHVAERENAGPGKTESDSDAF